MKLTPQEKKYMKIVWIFMLAMIMTFAYMDKLGYNMWGEIGGYLGEQYAAAGPLYQTLFWSFAGMLTILVAAMYWLFTKDFSESIGIWAGTKLLIYGGWEKKSALILFG